MLRTSYLAALALLFGLWTPGAAVAQADALAALTKRASKINVSANNCLSDQCEGGQGVEIGFVIGEPRWTSIMKIDTIRTAGWDTTAADSSIAWDVSCTIANNTCRPVTPGETTRDGTTTVRYLWVPMKTDTAGTQQFWELGVAWDQYGKPSIDGFEISSGQLEDYPAISLYVVRELRPGVGVEMGGYIGARAAFSRLNDVVISGWTLDAKALHFGGVAGIFTEVPLLPDVFAAFVELGYMRRNFESLDWAQGNATEPQPDLNEIDLSGASLHFGIELLLPKS